MVPTPLADGDGVGSACRSAGRDARSATPRDAHGRADRRRRPWDDAFTELAADPVLEWPGQLRLTVSSTCPWWVVYTMPEAALCVEPQSGPPDALNGTPEVVMPGTPLTHVMRWRWTPLG